MTAAYDPQHPQMMAIRLAEQTVKPLSALVEITHACNVDCEHCYLDLVPDKKIGALSTDEWKRVLGEIKAAGALYLTITGGEIMVRRDWFEIAAHARSLGFALTLYTNGTLIDDDAADRIATLRTMRVEISLLGGIAATHDAIARRRGAFDKTLAGVRRLRERGVKVILKCVVMRRNAEETAAIEAIASELGCVVQFDLMITPKNDASREPQGLGTERDALLPIARRIEELAGTTSCGSCDVDRDARLDAHPCAAGRRTAHVGPAGDVTACLQWIEPVGNVRATSFATIWGESELLARIRAARVKDFPSCSSCQLLAICAPCMALNQLEAGRNERLDGPSETKCNYAEMRAQVLGLPGRAKWLVDRESAKRAAAAGARDRVRLPLA
jgi:radical SAM protein with 4Fe4S-binding SPASM domain